jgi:hypothetical protein
MRILWITLGMALVLAVALFIGFSRWTDSYVRSEAFRSVISEATGKAFGANATFAPLRWTGSSVYCDSAALVGNPGEGLSTMSAHQLRAEVNWRAFFSGAWRVEEISMERLDGEWRPAEKSPPARGNDGPENAKSPSGIAALLPHRFELGHLNIAHANLAFGRARVLDNSLTITPDGNGWVFQGTGGNLELPFPPKLSIVDFRAREQGGELFLTRANLQLGQNGKILASGDSASGGKLDFSWEGVDASDLLTGEWKNRLSGVTSGNALANFPDQASGSFQLRDGLLQNMPFLATVADFTQDPTFRRMPLQEISADFTWENGTLHLTRFFCESKGLMRIEGSATIGKGGQLSGLLQVGVAPNSLRWLPGSRERVFKNSRDGYLWTPLTVGGTLEHPTEDLSPRLLAAMGADVIDQGTKVLNNAPGTAVDGVKGVLDILRPFVP